MHHRDAVVTACGRIHRKRVNLPHVFAGQRVGIKEVDEGTWIVSLMPYDLGFIEPGAENPATPGQPVQDPGVTYVSGTVRHSCVRTVPGMGWRRERDSNPRYGFKPI